MKKRLIIVILLSLFCSVLKAQVKGQLWMDSTEHPGASVTFKDSKYKVESNFDGYFSIPLPKKTERNSLIISVFDLNIDIQNLDLNLEVLDLGKIEIPFFKVLGIDQYEQLSENEKKYCYPLYHWSELLGYYSTRELGSELVILKCGKKHAASDYDSETRTITVDWSLIAECESLRE